MSQKVEDIVEETIVMSAAKIVLRRILELEARVKALEDKISPPVHEEQS